jgi:hypothetical protein
LVKSGSAPTGTPTDGTAYIANATYGSGTAIGDGYVAYNGTGSSFTLSGLSASTAYYLKIYEYNGTNTSINYLTSGTPAEANQSTAALSFAPTVTTPTSASITVNSATLGGNVTSDGGAAVTERGVVYSLTTANNNPTIGGTGVTRVTSSGTTGLFTLGVSGLTAASGYSYKAYATNSIGTTYTTVSTFTTLDPAPPVITNIQISGGNVLVDFNGGASDLVGSFTVVRTTNLTATFAPVAATITTSGPGVFRATLPLSTNTAAAFYRIKR